jgi:GMP synthase (glutamine-hydrolysing)
LRGGRTAVVLRHAPTEHLGRFAGVLAARGWSVRQFDVAVEDLDATAVQQADALIVLGGAVGAYQSDLFPFLTAELNALRARLAEDRPVLGVCLGAQLLAAAAGAAVFRGPETEIGFAAVRVVPDSAVAPFGGIPVLQWHGDTFELPAGARRVATSAVYENQAFELGSSLGVQFHPEVDARMLGQWLASGVGELLAAGIDPRRLRAEGAVHAEPQAAAGAEMLATWLEQVEATAARAD